MRRRFRLQYPIVERSGKHPHAAELQKIAEILEECPGIAELAQADLIRGLGAPEAGREGTMTAEQVLKVILIKQMTGFSYNDLEFHLEDSKTYRAFCGFGIAGEAPSASTLQRDIKKVTAETLEAANRILLEFASKKGHREGASGACGLHRGGIQHP